jgi:transcriptional regulator with XRE-family HTH domain
MSKRQDFEINQKLKQVRKMQGLTQAEFADEIGENVSYIKALETNKFTPHYGVIVAVHKLYGVAYEYLLEKQQPAKLIRVNKKQAR